MFLSDFNDDEYDDLVVSTPEADVVSMTDNGRVSSTGQRPVSPTSPT